MLDKHLISEFTMPSTFLSPTTLMLKWPINFLLFFFYGGIYLITKRSDFLWGNNTSAIECQEGNYQVMGWRKLLEVQKGWKEILLISTVALGIKAENQLHTDHRTEARHGIKKKAKLCGSWVCRSCVAKMHLQVEFFNLFVISAISCWSNNGFYFQNNEQKHLFGRHIVLGKNE